MMQMNFDYKKIFLWVICFCFLTAISNKSYAGNGFYGGEMYYKHLNGSLYKFYMVIYSNCTGTTPDPPQIEAAAQAGAPVVELHTGAYAESTGSRQATELERLHAGARLASSLGLEVHAGHGLHYHNVQPVAAIRDVVELNIGHAIIARAVFDGLPTAVREMKALMVAARE